MTPYQFSTSPTDSDPPSDSDLRAGRELRTHFAFQDFREKLHQAILNAVDLNGPAELNAELTTDAAIAFLVTCGLASALAQHLGCFPADLRELIGGDA
ncbi:MAG: hypothetical protein AAGI68_11270 [Planctomycetota bacterium]